MPVPVSGLRHGADAQFVNAEYTLQRQIQGSGNPVAVSVFDVFKVGIGPSSSHTVGPMRAARTFINRLQGLGILDQVTRIQATLFGSLAHTGRGHGTDNAVMLGLEGNLPDQIRPDEIPQKLEAIINNAELSIPGAAKLAFNPRKDLIFNKREVLPHHPNGMRFKAFDGHGDELATREYYSVGGGFVVNQDQAAKDRIVRDTSALPYPFKTGDELLDQCSRHDLRISQLMLANEQVWRPGDQVRQDLLNIWEAMHGCIVRGCEQHGILPGGLNVGGVLGPLVFGQLVEHVSYKVGFITIAVSALLGAVAADQGRRRLDQLMAG